MEGLTIKINSLEMNMWEAARKRDGKKFLDLVSEDAIMVCGGERCTGKEYAKVIEQFNLSTN